MLECKHKCKECNETWECTFPYYSNFHFYKTEVNNGYYCNAFCPSCQEKEREIMDKLFENMDETGYIKSFVEQSLKT